MKRIAKYVLLFCAGVAAASIPAWGDALPAQVSSDKAARAACDLVIQAVAKYQEGKTDEAEAFLYGALAVDERNDAAHYWLGNILAGRNDVEGTMSHFERAAQLDSTNQWYQSRLGNLYAALGQPEKAVPIFENLTASNHKNPEYMASLADAYTACSQLEKADSVLNKLEDYMGPSSYVDMSRLQVLRLRGRYDEYLQGMDKAFADPELPSQGKSDFIINFIRGGNPRFVISHRQQLASLVETCLRVHPKDTCVGHMAASFYYAFGDKDKVLQTCALFPYDKQMIYLELDVHYKASRWSDAVICCDRLIALAPSEVDDEERCTLHGTKADCLHYMGLEDKAYKEYETALECCPGEPMVLNNYAYMMACDGRNLAKCARMSRKAIEAESENYTYLDTYAWILYKQKKYKQAKVYFKKALIYGGKESDVILGHYADVLEALGETDLAEGYRQQAKLKKDAAAKKN